MSETQVSEVREFEGTVDELKNLFSDRAASGETMVLNLGPQHPSTHGVLRLILELDGEEVVRCVPDIGFLHTGIEKNMEAKTYVKALVMTDRMDYLNPLGTSAMDLNASSILIYCFRDRELLLDLFELVGGQRMMSSYIRPGGVWRDLPDEFVPAVEEFLEYLPGKLADYERLLTRNPIFLKRTVDVGVIAADEAMARGMTGASLRGSGVNYDVRRAMPYCGYENYDFDVPLEEGCDVYARYRVRMREFQQSMRIIRQAIYRLQSGSVMTNDRRFAPPPRSELGRSMEAVIHHFKYWTEGFSAPEGEVYIATESPRGELGCFLVGDGSAQPARVHFRTPSFNNLQSLPYMAEGYLVADLVAIIGSIDIVLGDVDR